jgi:hypothetical protein
MLGVNLGKLENALTYSTNYACMEIMMIVLSTKGSQWQQDHICAKIYAMLFAFIVKGTSRKTVPTNRSMLWEPTRSFSSTKMGTTHTQPWVVGAF